jgi:glycerol uptake facilitator protein
MSAATRHAADTAIDHPASYVRWQTPSSRGIGPRWDRFRARTGGELMAEFFGTFILILLGCGSVAVAVVGLPGSGRQTGAFGAADWLIVSLGWGLAVAFGVYVAGGVSGAHLNPAVTLAWATRRGFPLRKVPAYWAAQLAGALAGAGVVYAVYDSAINAYEQTHHLARAGDGDTFGIFATFPAAYFHGSVVGPFVDQVVGTAVLVAIIAALIDAHNQAPESNLAPLMVGLVVVAIGLSVGTNAGYAINPARDLGPRLVTWMAGWGSAAVPGDGSGFSAYMWVPIVGPLVGGVLGVLGYDAFVGTVLEHRPSEPEDAQPEPEQAEHGAGHTPARA